MKRNKKINTDRLGQAKAIFLEKIEEITYLEFFVLLLVAVFVVFVVKFFGRGPAEWKTIRVQVIGREWSEDFTGGSSYKPPFWLVDSTRKKDIVRGPDGKKMAEIIDVESYERGGNTSIFLIVKVKAFLNKKDRKYMYKNIPLQEGSLIEFSLPETKIVGQITDMGVPEQGYEEKTLIVVGRARNIEPWLIDRIENGDEMINLTTGETVAKIIDFKIEPTLSKIFFTGGGYFTNAFLEDNPRLKDVVLTLELKVKKISDRWFFSGDQKIKTPHTIGLFFSDYDLGWVEIQEFEEKQ